MAGVSDPAAFSAIYAQHASGVYSTALRVLGRAAAAEDVTQDVFLRLWQSPDRFDAKRSPIGAFLRLMARSRALDVWRQEQAGHRAQDRLEHTTPREDTQPQERPDEIVEAAETRETVRAAVRKLPPDQREALVLSFWGGMTGRELADHAGVPFGTARSRVRLGVEKIRADLGQEAAQPAAG